MKKKTDAKCVICKGEIVERIENEFVAFGIPIDGPDSEKQWANVSHGYHCVKCGLKYEFPPKEIEKAGG